MIARRAEWHSPGQLRTAQVDPHTDPRWDDFVGTHPDGLVFHHSLWLRVLEETYGFKAEHLVCEDEQGTLRGVLPMHRVHGPISGHGLYSLPRTPVAGPLALDRASASALMGAARQLTDREGGGLDLKVRGSALDGLAEGVVGRPMVTSYRLELPDPEVEVRFGKSDNHKGIRKAVKKAAREGVEVRPAESEADLQAWYTLYLETMRSHASLPRPYRYFRNCWNLLEPRGLMRLLVAERRSGGRAELLAGSVLLMHGEVVFSSYNGRRRDVLHLRPNDAIKWQTIHDAHAARYRFVDLGEVPAGSDGLAEFKAKWGAKPDLLYRYRYPASRQAKPDAHGTMGRVRPLVKGVWRRLPLRVTALVGDFVFSRL